MWPAFFIRVRPASRKAKPACMNITRTAATTTQIVLAAMRRSELSGTDLHLLEEPPGAMVRHVLRRRAPADPVARLVAAPRGVDDRRLHPLGDLVLHEEDQHRLRQEARLEHTAAVLVGDPALPAVPDRLDHGHADVPGRILDRVDHGLDPLADHHRLNLHHPLPPVARDHEKRPQRSVIAEAPLPRPAPAAALDLGPMVHEPAAGLRPAAGYGRTTTGANRFACARASAARRSIVWNASTSAASSASPKSLRTLASTSRVFSIPALTSFSPAFVRSWRILRPSPGRRSTSPRACICITCCPSVCGVRNASLARSALETPGWSLISRSTLSCEMFVPSTASSALIASRSSCCARFSDSPTK